MKKALLVFAIMATVSAAAPARAQEKGQLGLTAIAGWNPDGGESLIGLQYHLTERFALRPTFGYGRTEQKMEGWDDNLPPPSRMSNNPNCGASCPVPAIMPGPGREITSTYWNVGLAGLAYLARKDGFSSYLGASGAYARQSTETPVVAYMRTGSMDYTVKGHTWTFRGFFGLQYAPAKRFSLYGEAGLRYETSGGDQYLDSSRLSTVGASLGAIFYLK